MNSAGDTKPASLVQSRDQRRWAKRILYEQGRKGGRRYSPAVLAMAQRALGIEDSKS